MFKIKLPKEATLPKEEQPKCVIKISAGQWYMISRAINFEFVEKELKAVFKKYMYRGGVNEENLYYPLIKRIVEDDIQQVEVSILFTSESGYSVLKEELKQLEENFGKRYCVNKNNIPHVPKFKTESTTNKSKWLTQNEFLNFKKLLTKYEY